MLCLAHNLATERARALRLPVWRYRFDLVADNLNSRGVRIGAFHGARSRLRPRPPPALTGTRAA